MAGGGEGTAPEGAWAGGGGGRARGGVGRGWRKSAATSTGFTRADPDGDEATMVMGSSGDEAVEVLRSSGDEAAEDKRSSGDALDDDHGKFFGDDIFLVAGTRRERRKSRADSRSPCFSPFLFFFVLFFSLYSCSVMAESSVADNVL
ncbi:hypothetical protein BRADI_2g11293v3 [Brachypodium distachyon]|uniref:Uncharacterized protein n=1 Tax=Brachypodium distachyon TaxID=15368 RepID=A0A0Q3IUD1_BRADI|nr:hypothetical protein BRADI_2g11293v3 [Brachypodium distachyon]